MPRRTKNWTIETPTQVSTDTDTDTDTNSEGVQPLEVKESMLGIKLVGGGVAHVSKSGMIRCFNARGVLRIMGRRGYVVEHAAGGGVNSYSVSQSQRDSLIRTLTQLHNSQHKKGTRETQPVTECSSTPVPPHNPVPPVLVPVPPLTPRPLPTAHPEPERPVTSGPVIMFGDRWV